MSTARRWVAVVTDPASSDAVHILKLGFYTGLPCVVFNVVVVAAGWAWPTLIGPFTLVWVYWLLQVTRERDHARAALSEIPHAIEAAAEQPDLGDLFGTVGPAEKRSGMREAARIARKIGAS